MAGLRIATVTVISLATIGAYVIDQGLGSPIFKAIGINFTTEMVAAGGLAVLLALSADGLLVVTQRALTPWARRGVAR
jgi:osmoprotectant transport system permease protein